MVGAYKPREAEGLAGRVEGDRSVSGVLRDALRGDMLKAGHYYIGPDLIGDDSAAVVSVDLHGFLYLLPLPDSSGGVVRGAEDADPDIVLLYLSVHVFIIHAPDAFFIPFEL